MDTLYKLLRHRRNATDKGILALINDNRESSLLERVIDYVNMDKDFYAGYIEPKKTDYLQMDQYGQKIFIDELQKFTNEERRYLNALGLKHLVDDIYFGDKSNIIKETINNDII